MRLLESTPRGAYVGTVFIRLMVGAVFLSEGLQKFIYPAGLGPGRFERIGFSSPEFWANFVAVFEVACGVMVLLGLLTRLAAIPLFIDMVVAIVTTKIPILLGRALGPFTLRELSEYGFWSMAHEARTDWAMLLGSLFLILAGGGPLSLDNRMGRGQGRRFERKRSAFK